MPLLFFDEKLQEVLKYGMNVTKPLGWSSTFMKSGIALFMLLLYQGNGLLPGCREMCSRVASDTGFSAKEYAKGLDCTFDWKKQDLFWHLFEKWRVNIAFSESEQLEVLEKLHGWIDMRVEGIMQNNRRSYYWECAAFVAALGEVHESRGERGGKDRVLKQYKAKYSRRTAFHAELRAFGMRDGK